ncbi:MAG: hypothetical protein WBV82_24025 [Myxococcaceae bacterium]
MIWQTWKQGFNAWEGATAKLFEQWLGSPLVLEPMGSLLTISMKAKAAQEKALASCWGVLGLPTRRDQERTLYALNQLQSRLIDLEERLARKE